MMLPSFGSNIIIGDGVIADDMGNLQRALVFQGGGALGAYEDGTYQQMYRKVARRGNRRT